METEQAGKTAPAAAAPFRYKSCPGWAGTSGPSQGDTLFPRPLAGPVLSWGWEGVHAETGTPEAVCTRPSSGP